MNRRLFTAAVGTAVAMSLGPPVATAQAQEQPGAPAESFIVVVGSNESIEHAITELAQVRHDLVPAMDRTLAAMERSGRPVSTPGGLLSVDDIDALRSAVSEASQAPPGGALVADSAYQSDDPADNDYAASTSGDSVVAAESPSFEGAQRLDSIRCAGSACRVVASITHNHLINLGWTTFQSTGKTSGSRTGWTGLAARGTCTIMAGSHPQCGGPYAIPSTATWTQKVFRFTWTAPSPASLTVTFSGAYQGVPGSVSGRTPTWTCRSANRQCYFP